MYIHTKKRDKVVNTIITQRHFTCCKYIVHIYVIYIYIYITCVFDTVCRNMMRHT